MDRKVGKNVTLPTGRQVARLLTRGNVCVRAGAGTGKTGLLVELFLKMLRDKQASLSEVAALTFTEKAAAEMKERIRAACRDQEQHAASQPDQHYWRAQVYELERAHICTIHGFCSRMLREFPLQAGIDPQFQVLDELSADALAGDAMRDALTALVEAEDKDIIELLKHLGRRKLQGALIALLKDREKSEPIQDLPEDAPASRRKVLALLDEHVHRALCSGDCQHITTALKANRSSKPEDKLEQRRQQALEIMDRLTEAKDPEASIRLACKLEELLKNTGRLGNSNNWSDNQRQQVRTALRHLKNLLGGLAPLSKLLVDTNTDEKLFQLARSLIRVYQKVNHTYQLRKADAGSLDYSDLLICARELLKTNPEITHRFHRRLKYILVDEFQDNSRLDQQIIHLLAAKEPEAESAHPRGPVPGKLFVVGDDKQSIFRFRGAEPEVFNELAETLEKEGQVVNLNRNYRSLPAIIAFTNDLFSKVMGLDRKVEAFQNQYLALQAHRKGNPKREAVELLLAGAPAGNRLSAPEAHILQAELIARRIALMIANQEPVVEDQDGRFCPPTFADLAILLRTTTHISAYKRALSRYQIPYAVIADRGFYQAQEIIDCANFLKFLDNEADEIALAGILRSPFFAVSDNALYHLSFAPGFRQGMENYEEYELAPQDREKLARARQVINRLRILKGRRTLPELIDAMVELTGYDVVLLCQFMGRQKWANLRKLRAQAATVAPTGRWSLHRFVQYLDPLIKAAARGGEAASEEEKSNVVKLITIHKAKGLEFPVVFLPGLSDGRRANPEQAVLSGRNLGIGLRLEDIKGQMRQSSVHGYIHWLNNRKREAESKRLFYVACTRARDLLVLAGIPSKHPTNSWMTWLENAFQISPDANGADSFFRFGPDEAWFRGRVRTNLPPVETRTGSDKAAPRKAAIELSEQKLSEMLCLVAPVAVNLSRKRHFTTTSLADYDFCPRRYQLKHVMGIPEPDLLPGEPSFEKGESAAGEAIGAGGTARLKGTIAHHILGNLDWSKDLEELRRELLPEMLKRELEGEVLLPPQVCKKLAGELEVLIGNLISSPLANALHTATQRYPELPFSLRLDSVIIEGRIDLLFEDSDKRWRILDYKTDAIDSDQVAYRSQIHWPQLLIYALACEKLDRRPAELLLCFLRPACTSRFALDQSKLDQARAKTLATITPIKQNEFPRARQRCASCPYAGICEKITS